jgi:GNAT superfamily N-acetyltransferase
MTQSRRWDFCHSGGTPLFLNQAVGQPSGDVAHGTMIRFNIELDLNPKQSYLDELAAGLNEHSERFVEKAGFQPIALFARDKLGCMHGGIYGRINWSWLNVSLLWVSSDNRGCGLGSALLERLETEAAALGCTKSHVDTFSFQAQEFYVANGYETFAELPDYPDTHSRIYLKKSLSVGPN